MCVRSLKRNGQCQPQSEFRKRKRESGFRTSTNGRGRERQWASLVIPEVLLRLRLVQGTARSQNGTHSEAPGTLAGTCDCFIPLSLSMFLLITAEHSLQEFIPPCCRHWVSNCAVWKSETSSLHTVIESIRCL